MKKSLYYINGDTMKGCLNCNKEIPKRNKYCSLECQKEYECEKYIANWKKGLKNGMRGQYQLSMHIKNYLLEKYNYKCSKCGWGEVNINKN